MNTEVKTVSIAVMLTPKEIATILDISLNNTYELLRSEDPGFPIKKFGKQYRVPREAFIKWLNLSTVCNF